MIISEADIFKKRMVKLVFTFILISFIFRYYNHALLHQMLQPVVFKVNSDLTYWVYHIVGFAKFIAQNKTAATIFDCLLIGLCIVTIIRPQRITIIAFSILYPIYLLSYNSFVTHHYGNLIGILFITFAFWSKKEITFKFLWEALRYYTLFIYSMAFVYKVFINVSVFNITQPLTILKDNLVLYLYQNPDTFFANCLYWFINNPLVLYVGYIFCISMQGCMIAGFFTKKFDRILFFLPILFHSSTYFFVDVFYFELLILNFTFFDANSFNKVVAYFKTKMQFFDRKQFA